MIYKFNKKAGKTLQKYGVTEQSLIDIKEAVTKGWDNIPKATQEAINLTCESLDFGLHFYIKNNKFVLGGLIKHEDSEPLHAVNVLQGGHRGKHAYTVPSDITKLIYIN